MTFSKSLVNPSKSPSDWSHKRRHSEHSECEIPMQINKKSQSIWAVLPSNDAPRMPHWLKVATSFAEQINRRMWPFGPFPCCCAVWQTKILKTTCKCLLRILWNLVDTFSYHYATFALMMMPTDAILSLRVERLISPTVIWTGKLPPLSSLFIFTKDCRCRSWLNLSPYNSRDEREF